MIFNAFDDCIEIVFDVNFALRKTLEFMIFFLSNQLMHYNGDMNQALEKQGP